MKGIITCAQCQKVFQSSWSDEEAKKEAEEIFGKHPDDWNDEQVVICDDCFQRMHPLNHPDFLEESKKHL